MKTMSEKFSVYQFFKDNGSEQVAELVDMETAVDKFAHFSNSVGAKVGAVVRVIITDGGDCVNAEWKYGEGITYPPELKNIDLTRRKK
jgi:hypothetical protein